MTDKEITMQLVLTMLKSDLMQLGPNQSLNQNRLDLAAKAYKEIFEAVNSCHE